MNQLSSQEMDKVRLQQDLQSSEARCACLLLLDTSASMGHAELPGSSISQLNQGLREFAQALRNDHVAASRVEVGIVTFGGEVDVRQDFVLAHHFEPPHLTSNGMTPMGSAVLKGIELLEERKAIYRDRDLPYYRPLIFLITDGEPQGETPEVFDEATRRVLSGERKAALSFFAIGVENANMEKLKTLAVRQPLKLQGLKFSELFQWLSNSLRALSQTQIEKVGDFRLPPPGWADLNNPDG